MVHLYSDTVSEKTGVIFYFKLLSSGQVANII